MRIINKKVFDATSSAASVNSGPVDISSCVSVSLQVAFTDGASAGTFKLQASNDMPKQGDLSPFTPTNWSDIPSASATVTVGGVHLILVTNVSYMWLRAVWTRSAGAGTMTATVKSIGV